MSTQVNYIKHWDNDTKGFMEYATNNLASAISMATVRLIDDAIADGVDGNSDPAELFTITKVELVEATTWTGVPKAAF